MATVVYQLDLSDEEIEELLDDAEGLNDLLEAFEPL